MRSRLLSSMSRTCRYLKAPSASVRSQAASRRAIAVALGQAEQPQAGAVAVLGVLVLLEDAGDDFAGGHADALAPLDQPLRRPVAMGAVRRRHVVVDRREAAAPARARVACDPVAAQAAVRRHGP